MLVPIGGRRIRHDLIGPEDASVVCLAHCLSGDSGVWAEQLPPLLAAGWRVLVPDMRGHGGSDPGERTCRMEDLAADVVLLLDALGMPKVHFVGLSIGGMIGQALALDHRERLASLFLTGTSPQAVPGGMAMWDARFEAIAAAGSLHPIADDSIRRWFTASFARANRLRQIRETVACTSPAGYRAGAEAIIAFDVLDRLAGVTTPTLVVCGDDDPGTPPEGNRAIAERVPGARYVEIADARHLPMVQHPALRANPRRLAGRPAESLTEPARGLPRGSILPSVNHCRPIPKPASRLLPVAARSLDEWTSKPGAPAGFPTPAGRGNLDHLTSAPLPSAASA